MKSVSPLTTAFDGASPFRLEWALPRQGRRRAYAAGDKLATAIRARHPHVIQRPFDVLFESPAVAVGDAIQYTGA
jgi:hypothetical protein